MTAIDVLTDKKMMHQAKDFAATAEFLRNPSRKPGTAKAGMKTAMRRLAAAVAAEN